MNKDKEITTVNDGEEHVAHDPHFEEPRRGLRTKFPNRKYAAEF